MLVLWGHSYQYIEFVSLPLTLVTLVILIEVKGKPVLLPNLFLFTLWFF